jgi:hypothetical protein
MNAVEMADNKNIELLHVLVSVISNSLVYMTQFMKLSTWNNVHTSENAIFFTNYDIK